MGEIQYAGEHLYVGSLGRFFVLLALSTALLALIANAFGSKTELEEAQRRWRGIARTSFVIHGVSILSVIVLIFHMMLNRYYEYEYVWAHVSDDLPFKYIFSAFWEGQEGSFLLWMFWNVVLGFFLLWKGKRWELPVMMVIAAAQLFLVSMIVGMYMGPEDAKLGSTPFALLREVNAAPIFQTANYVESIEGTGLNPLLQNYWMTIHPPTLFLGFAATIVPFAYAFAGLWTGEHRAWIKPALRWALFTAAVLGIGILMGGAWAYEALSFGGYWAWDPVENSSLVPWLTLVAGLHTAVVARSTGQSIRSTYVFFFLTFILILYSTFLTRSGALQETSVHAFTEMGLERQLIAFVAFFTLIPFGLYFYKYKKVPTPQQEEELASREFWMFIGALVLLFSATIITFITSAPVFETILNAVERQFGWAADTFEIAPPEDEIAVHNRYQIWVGIAVALMSSVTQFLRYRAKKVQRLAVLRMSLAAIIAAIAAGFLAWIGQISYWPHILLLWAGAYAIWANLDYLFSVSKGSPRMWGSTLSHLGFGTLLIGVIFSGVNKTSISQGFDSLNTTVMGQLNPQSDKSLMLLKGNEVPIVSNYFVRYTKDTVVDNAQFFILDFTRRDRNGKVIEAFQTKPYVLREPEVQNGVNTFKMLASNPDTKHYWFKDIFTLAVPKWAVQEPEVDTFSWQTKQIAIGDTFYTRRNYVIFEGLEYDVEHPDLAQKEKGDLAVGIKLTVRTLDADSTWIALPVYALQGQQPVVIEDDLPELGLSFKITRINPQAEKFEVQFKEKRPELDFVVMQALVFPGINFVWLGSTVMMLGFFISLWVRWRDK